MALIKKIKLQNFKRFQEFSVDLDDRLNLLIGDNESGKSSILSAIDIVLSGSRNKVEMIGLDSLFNIEVIQGFLKSTKKYEDLPILYVELYLEDQNNPDLNGRINSEDVECDGLQLLCEPDDTLSKEIKVILKQQESNFPFEYYSVIFKTFSGEGYAGYRKFLRHVLIDNSQINNEYATREYVKTMYNSNVDNAEKNKHQNEYRKHKEIFRANVLSDLNKRITDYSFTIRTSSKANLETDLTISEDDICLENKGKGKQCFIRTEFALKKRVRGDKELNVILLEEPENHLSHINMKKLIRKISGSENKQLFIATHSDLISTRLDLRKSILLNSNNSLPVLLKDLPEDTAKFFIKAPNNNVLEFILSRKVILVEGDAEYILMDVFFQKIANEKLEDSDVHVISVGGTSFKRYLDLAKLLQIKTAVIRDNDSDFQAHCIDNFSDYTNCFIKIFFDRDNDRHTFEVALYQDNSAMCDELFKKGRRKLSAQEYMLQNKADSAFELLNNKGDEIYPPKYIREAIQWIRE